MTTRHDGQITELYFARATVFASTSAKNSDSTGDFLAITAGILPHKKKNFQETDSCVWPEFGSQLVGWSKEKERVKAAW